MTQDESGRDGLDTRSRLWSVARVWLADPEQIPHFERPRYAHHRMRLWHYPSMRGPWVSIILYEGDTRRFRPSGLSPVLELTWDRFAHAKPGRADDPNAPAPENPSVTWRQCLIPTDVLKRHYEALQQLVFRPFSPSGMGTDGFVRGVEAALGFGTTSIAWWGRVPKGFEPLASWYNEIWSYVVREMDTAQQAAAPATVPRLRPAGKAPRI